MPRQQTATSSRPWRGNGCPAWLYLFAWLWLLCLPAASQTVESVFSPGPLTSAHARWEGSCKHCHVPFDRQAQDRLCADCHKDIGHDLAQRSGYHGRIKPQPCRACHTEHRGREMRIVDFDQRRFDHQQTDFALLGKHRDAACAKCHRPAQKFSAAPHECQACHRADDVHKGSMGAQCAKCHDEQSWKTTKFDHGATRFPLTGAHVKARCETCHKAGTDHRSTPQACVACHRKDDRHKAQFGEKCESCHTTQAWPQITFRHDTDTRFPLRARHRELRCTTCHTGLLFRDKLGTACVECHRKDDRHRGSLGADCASCHTERNWKEGLRFDHGRTSFALRGRHAQAACKDCHATPVFKEVPGTCIGCHRKDDRHEATLGERCAECHTDAGWKPARFDHAGTRFPLRGAHAAQRVQCVACHKDLRSFRNTALECVSCHRRDDRHEGQLGTDCAACHDQQRWPDARFDHAKARFVLSGAHVTATCQSCHKSPRYRDAPRECAACHQALDVHKGGLGTACESCHNTRDWRLWRFSHDQQTDFPLAGAHAKVRCQACHAQPAPAGRKVATVGRDCIGCHAKDDEHDRAYGTRCEQCHQPTRWSQITNRRLPMPPGGGRK